MIKGIESRLGCAPQLKAQTTQPDANEPTMCEFCLKHGEGRKWYLEARNYSFDLVRDKRKFRRLLDRLSAVSEAGAAGTDRLRRLLGVPVIGRAFSWLVTRKMKQVHFGQVLTLEDVERVFRLVDVIHGFPCVCRKYLLSGDDERYCFALGTFFHDVLDDAPDLAGTGEELTAEEACRRARAFEEKGLLHTIWTLETPFIIGICSCRPGECLAMELHTNLRTQVMFRGEYRFEIPAAACVGCGKCLETCYFGAIGVDGPTGTCTVEADRCHGCGLCSRACPVGAPRPVERPRKCRSNGTGPLINAGSG